MSRATNEKADDILTANEVALLAAYVANTTASNVDWTVIAEMNGNYTTASSAQVTFNKLKRTKLAKYVAQKDTGSEGPKTPGKKTPQKRGRKADPVGEGDSSGDVDGAEDTGPAEESAEGIGSKKSGKKVDQDGGDTNRTPRKKLGRPVKKAKTDI